MVAGAEAQLVDTTNLLFAQMAGGHYLYVGVHESTPCALQGTFERVLSFQKVCRPLACYSLMRSTYPNAMRRHAVATA